LERKEQDQMSPNTQRQRRAVIITGPGFQDEEFIYPYYRLQEAGFIVDVATKDKEIVYGKFSIPAKATIDTKDLREEDYDLVILPGGHEAPDRVRQDKKVLDFVKSIDERGKVLAAICHGPWILISANVVRGRKATCYVGMADDLRNAQAIYVDEPVVEDGNLITAPHYRNNGDFMKAILKRFSL
jgi:protease I